MIAIVGGGISGLALGVSLVRAGVEVRVFEAKREVGGVIRTVSVGEHTLELGPQRLRGTPEILAHLQGRAIHRVGPEHARIFVVRGGTLHPLPRSLPEFLRSRAISVRGKARAALEPLVALLPAQPGASAADLLRRRLGSEVYRAFAGPLLGGLYGSDPEEIDAERTVRPAMRTLGIRTFAGAIAGGSSALPEAPVVVPAEGMVGLPRALAEEVRDFAPHALLTDTPVRRVHRLDPGRFLLETPAGSHEAEVVVLTTPPPATARLLGPVAPTAAEQIGSLRMNPIEMVHLEVPELPAGLGFKVAFGEGLPIRGATWSGNLDGRGRTAVVYLEPSRVGPDGPGALADPTDAMTMAAESFTAVTGIPAHPIHHHCARMPAWDRSWRALDGLSLPDGIHLLGSYTGRPGIPGRLAAGASLARTLVEARHRGRSQDGSGVP